MIESFKLRAIENFHSAEALFDLGYYNASANRAYYAIFHCALVELLKRGYKPPVDHRNVQSLFIKELINRKKVLSSQMKNIFVDAMELRNDADYKNGVTKTDAKKQVAKTGIFLKTIFKEF